MKEGRRRGWVVGITGASGVRYGLRLVTELLKLDYEVHLVVSDAGWRVIKEEEEWDLSNRKTAMHSYFTPHAAKLYYHSMRDIGAGFASGTYRIDGMCIIPCSMGTLAAVAHGLSDNLLERAADVMLKEKRPLIIVPRETPLSEIHLRNMLVLSQIGVTILPAMPAFYHHPTTIEAMIDFIVGKTLDAMGIDHQLFKRWGES